MTRSWVEVPLTKGKVAKIDRQDMLIIGRWKWYAYQSKNSTWYSRHGFRVDGKQHSESMHRLIMQPPPGMVVDHINGDGLDNRRSNLRVCLQRQNLTNRRRRSTKIKREFVGVWPRTLACGVRWQFRVAVDGRVAWCGGFLSAEDAARARDRVAIKLHGEFAATNFPTPTEKALCPEAE